MTTVYDYEAAIPTQSPSKHTAIVSRCQI